VTSDSTISAASDEKAVGTPLGEVPSSEYEAEEEDDEAEEAWTFVGADEVILEPETLLRRSTLLGPVSTTTGILAKAELMAEQEELDEKKGMSKEQAEAEIRRATSADAAAVSS
jgi:hypothetical protein